MAMVINAQEAALLLEQVLDRVALGREDVMIERPHGEPVVLLPLDEYLELTAALIAGLPADDEAEHEGAEVFSLDARRRRREERSAGTAERRLTAPEPPRPRRAHSSSVVSSPGVPGRGAHGSSSEGRTTISLSPRDSWVTTGS